MTSLSRATRLRLGAAAVILVAIATPAIGAAGASPSALPAPMQAQQSDRLVQMMGMNIHLLNGQSPYGDFAQVQAHLVDLGIRHVRTNYEPDRRDLATETSKLEQDGIHTDFVMNDTASTTDLHYRVHKIASGLSSAVEAVEPPNEWNYNGPAASWASQDKAYSRDLYREVRAEPTLDHVQVFGPSLALRTGYDDLGNLSSSMDRGNIHLYPGGFMPTKRMDEQLADEQTVDGGKPTVVTEAGYHNAMKTTSQHFPITAALAAQYEPRLFLNYFQRHVPRVYQYELYDEAPDPSMEHQNQNFGLIKANNSVKPAYNALHNLIALTADPGARFTPGSLSLSISGETDPTLQHVLLERRDGTFLLMLWRDVSIWDPKQRVATPVAPENETVTFGQLISSAQVYRPSSSPNAVSNVSLPTQVTVPLAGDVAAIVIHPLG